ncbi:hypothetical protein JOB18_018387 [Solea senegalensis]|uniref:Uncharacterized protein n=1 Tax=Solea senegalensis TaxID=28829 RepID=A0AAV6SL85_SOLSE|nr:hypothetical protein JOB18_018387 [Solea senegalensis]
MLVDALRDRDRLNPADLPQERTLQPQDARCEPQLGRSFGFSTRVSTPVLSEDSLAKGDTGPKGASTASSQ